MRYSDVFDTDDTKDIIYRSVTNATREMVREWLDQNLASIAKEVINEALDRLSKKCQKLISIKFEKFFYFLAIIFSSVSY